MKKRWIQAVIIIGIGAAVSAAFLLWKEWKKENDIVLDCPEVYPESALENISEEEIERKVNALLAAMTEEEMYGMLGGSHSAASARGCGTGYVGGVPRLGVPVLRMWDGPKGVTGDGNYPTTSPASELALAASFSEELAAAYGELLASDNRASGGNVQLGVQIDHVRAPFFMRSRDSFSEDPYLTSRLGLALASSIEKEHVISVLKHLACFSSMFAFSDEIQVDEQTLHELYLAPFAYILKNQGASAVMSAYNSVNGVAASENTCLQKTVLRDMWGFEGMTLTDWGGNHTLTTHLGTDLEMALLDSNTRENVETAIQEGTMDWEDVETAVRHTLTAMGRAGYLGLVQVKGDGTAAIDPTPVASIELCVTEGEERYALLEKNDEIALKTAAEGAVLLKNDHEALPIDEEDDVVLIGLLSRYTMNHCHESSYGWLEKMDGTEPHLRELLGEEAEITSEIGLDIIGEVIPGACLYTTEECEENGVLVSIDDGKPLTEEAIRMTTGTVDGKANRTFKNSENGNALVYGQHVSITTYLKAPETGVYELQLLKIGGLAEADIRVEQEEIRISGSGTNVFWPLTGDVPTEEGMDVPESATEVHLVKDRVYKITVEAKAQSQTKDLQISLNWFRPGQREEEYQKAVEAAASHKKVIYFAYDNAQGTGDYLAFLNRSGMELEEGQLSLLNDVIRAAKEKGNEVIVVLYTGLPVTMDWLDDVDAVVEMWLAGQSGGKAAAQILTGVKNPSGKLPVTFPRSADDTQFGDFEGNYRAENVNIIDYWKGGEGIFSGYRWYDREGIEPLFAFGYGLSYTEFAYSDLSVKREGDGFAVTFTVRNTGKVTGTEIAQVYLGAAKVPDYVQMPEYKLVGFERIEDLKPQESRTVTAKIAAEELQYWDAGLEVPEGTEKWVLAEGERTVYVGSSSDKLLLSQNIVVK